MITFWITALAFAGLSVSLCQGQQKLYYLAPCKKISQRFEYPGNCQMFMICTSYGLYPMHCASNTVFDQISEDCLWPYQVPKCLTPVAQPCINGKPCVNGKCQFGPNSNFCICDTWYQGQLCDVMDPCQSSPCANGGRCQSSGTGSYTCNCTGTGFGGANCATNFCDPSPCTHGRCARDSSGFSCDCQGSGYEGVFCDIPVQPPNSTCATINPCVRGTCLQLVSGPFCDCKGTGYTGPTCNTIANNRDYCYPGACPNGVCVSQRDSYVCDCTGTVYAGPRCDMTACEFLGYNPCMNGATCLAQPMQTYRCACPVTFTGGNCETLLIPPNCPNYQCPVDVPRFNYPDWQDLNCFSYYNCEYGTLQRRTCSWGNKFDVITMVCKPATDPQAIFCEYFRN